MPKQRRIIMNEVLTTIHIQNTGTKGLVLGGGGSMGIAWETGYLVGLADGGIDTRVSPTWL